MGKKHLLLISIPLLGYMVWWGNIKPFLASRAALRGDYKRAFAYHTFVNYEARKFLAKKAQKSDDPDFVVFARDQIQKNIKNRAHDCKSYILLSYLEYRLGRKQEAKQAVLKALKLAPNRPDLKALLAEMSD